MGRLSGCPFPYFGEGKGKVKIMLKVNIGGKEYKIKFGYAPVLKERIVSKMSRIGSLFEGDEVETETMEDALLFIPEIFLVGLQVNHPEFRYDYDTKAGREDKLREVYEIMDQFLADGGDMFKLFEDMQNEMVNDSFLSSLLRKGKAAEKVEESASVQQN